MAKFTKLLDHSSYDIFDASTGGCISQGISGDEATQATWAAGAKAYDSFADDGEPVDVAEATFTFQRCRSHEVQNTPMAWESQEEDLTIAQAIHRFTRAFYDGGDSFRAVRASDGESFTSNDLLWMRDNLSGDEIATMKQMDFAG